MKKTTYKIQKPSEEVNTNTVSDIDFSEIVPNVIDTFLVTIYEGHHTIFLPSQANNTQLRNWYKGKGGVYSRDVLNYSRNKPTGKYIRIKGKSLNCIARLISEEEVSNFKTLKLIDGTIKDRPYMILKSFENDVKLTSTIRYDDKDIMPETDVYIATQSKVTLEDDFDHHTGSISLFTE